MEEEINPDFNQLAHRIAKQIDSLALEHNLTIKDVLIMHTHSIVLLCMTQDDPERIFHDYVYLVQEVEEQKLIPQYEKVLHEALGKKK